MPKIFVKKYAVKVSIKMLVKIKRESTNKKISGPMVDIIFMTENASYEFETWGQVPGKLTVGIFNHEKSGRIQAFYTPK